MHSSPVVPRAISWEGGKENIEFQHRVHQIKDLQTKTKKKKRKPQTCGVQKVKSSRLIRGWGRSFLGERKKNEVILFG